MEFSCRFKEFKLRNTMKHCYIFLVFTLFATIAVGQVEINPDVIILESDGSNVDVKIEVTNSTGDYLDIYWMLEKAADFPEEWGITVCDDEICYLENTFKSSPNLPNDMVANYTFTFKFTITGNGVAGKSYGILHLYSDSKCDNEVAVSNPPPTSVDREIIEDIELFPNPASDFFSIRNDKEIKSIEVLSVTGKGILNEKHNAGQRHNIMEVSSGVYFVVLKDANGKNVKTLRLLK